MRYIPVPTGNSPAAKLFKLFNPVYPCTYRELLSKIYESEMEFGISLYLQGTQLTIRKPLTGDRYIPVPTGNSHRSRQRAIRKAVYPCTYRELFYYTVHIIYVFGISLYLQGTH